MRLSGRRWIKRMPNSYTYVDTDYIYTEPQTGVLRNIGNIGDNETLQFIEGLFRGYGGISKEGRGSRVGLFGKTGSRVSPPSPTAEY